MFRDKEIIEIIKDKTKHIDDKIIILEANIVKLTRKIEDIESLAMTTNAMIDDFQEYFKSLHKHMFSSEQVKKLIKDTIAEYKKEMFKPEKVTLKKISKKK